MSHANRNTQVNLLGALLFSVLALAHLSLWAQGTQGAESGTSACGPTPTCGEPPQCSLRDVTTQRDTRNCTQTLALGIKFHDPACEADKARVNQMIEIQRQKIQQEYRQCLVAQESHRVQCDVRQSEWETCISKSIPQFPPKTSADRRFLYQRCVRSAGKDEFTNDCCTHLYVADRTTLGVCLTKPTAPR